LIGCNRVTRYLIDINGRESSGRPSWWSGVLFVSKYGVLLFLLLA
jgi:hypothetical protein